MVSTWAIFPTGGKFAITRASLLHQGDIFVFPFLGGSTTCLLGQIAFKLSYFAIGFSCAQHKRLLWQNSKPSPQNCIQIQHFSCK